MPTAPPLTPSVDAFPGAPAAKKASMLLGVQHNQISAPTQPYHEPAARPPQVPHTATHLLRSTTDHDAVECSAIPPSAEDEDEYTLSAYGDISLGEVVVPPLPSPTRSDSLRPRIPQPRLRLKVQRPPMPKRRLSYHVPDPVPHSGNLEHDETKSNADKSPWFQHPPLVFSLPVDPTGSGAQESNPVKKGESSLEKVLDELLPRLPSIRLSPPGSPASQALSLPQSSPAAGPRQDKPWRTRLPPRLPIPKWDM